MRVIELMVKYLLFIVLIFSSFFILFVQLVNIPDKLISYVPAVNEYINGYTLLVCVLISAAFSFISPMWDVGKHLNIQNVEEINKIKRREQQEFAILVFGFIGCICLCGKLDSFIWVIGIFLLVYVYFRIILLKVRRNL
ncbi:MAG: hypothetical protein AB1333_00210 [Patescibacteria group bacterium]